MNGRKEGDENPKPSVVAETLKILANRSYGYQIMDRSRHTVTKNLIDEKTDGAIDNKMFKCLGYMNGQLHEVGLVMSDIEDKEPIYVGIFIRHY